MKTLAVNRFILLSFALLLVNYRANCKELKVKLIINGTQVLGVKYYLILNRKGHLLSFSNNQITLPDSLTTKYEILIIYRKYHTLIPMEYSDIQYLEIYYDDRIKHNLASEKSGERWLKVKCLLKKKYLIMYGNGMEAISTQSKSDYKERYDLIQ